LATPISKDLNAKGFLCHLASAGGGPADQATFSAMPPASPLSGHVLTNGDRTKRLGRIQLQCRRALIALSRVRIGDLLEWAYPHATEFKHWHRKSIHRAIIKVGIPVGKTRERHATTWQLRTLPKSHIGTKEDKT
jgi:hypothetical protein